MSRITTLNGVEALGIENINNEKYSHSLSFSHKLFLQ